MKQDSKRSQQAETTAQSNIKAEEAARKQKLFKKAAKYFQAIGTIILLGMSCIFFNLFDFRQHAKSLHIFTVSPQSFFWCALSIVLHLILKRLLAKIFKHSFQAFLHPRSRMGDSKYLEQKLHHIFSQSYDFCYHLFVVLFAFYQFREEAWFPQVLGGQGSCININNDFPQWPSNTSNLTQAILIYYQIQLGTSIYLILEVVLLERERYKESNYEEMVFHHFVTTSLIVTSLHFNYIRIGVAVFFVHDFSDMWRGLSRVFGESKFCIVYPRFGVLFNNIYLLAWVVMRIFIFPYCLINNHHEGMPTSESEFSQARFAGWYITTVLTCLYFLQCYWGLNIYRANKAQAEKNKPFISAYQAETSNKQIKNI